MYISQVNFLHHRCEGIDILRLAIGHNLYAYHQLLWTLFPQTPPGESPFLFHVIEKEEGFKANQLSFIVVSKKQPVSSVSYWDIHVKPYMPVVNDGDVYQFRIRVNPTVARKMEGKKHSSRHDVIMNRKYENRKSNIQTPMAEIVQEEGLKWIQAKQESCGFSLVSSSTILMHRYMQHCLSKGSKSEGSDIRLSTLDYDGQLEITNREKFLFALFNGFGPAKSFGCGLMLVKKIKST